MLKENIWLISTLPIIFQSKQYPPPIAAYKRSRVSSESLCGKVVVYKRKYQVSTFCYKENTKHIFERNL